MSIAWRPRVCASCPSAKRISTSLGGDWENPATVPAALQGEPLSGSITRGLAALSAPLVPVVAKELDRVRRPDGAVAACQVVRGTQLVAAPADAVGMSRVQRNLHWSLSHDDAPPRP